MFSPTELNPAGENTMQGQRLFINFIIKREHQQGQNMKSKLFFVSFFIFAIVYVGLVFFTGPFLMTWGAKRNFFERIYAGFIGGPFSYSESLWLIPVNAFIWFFIFYFFVFLLGGIKKKTPIR